jgi:hypothetical protein
VTCPPDQDHHDDRDDQQRDDDLDRQHCCLPPGFEGALLVGDLRDDNRLRRRFSFEMSLRSSASSAATEILVVAAIWRSAMPRPSRASRSFPPKSIMPAPI